MSAFYVGQRVRLVKSRSPMSSALLGGEFVIFAVGLLRDSEFDPCDAWICGGANIAVMNWQIEPVVPPHEPAELTVEELLPFLRGVTA